MSELTLHQKQMKQLGDENRKLTLKLKEVRTIMRQHNIGHLYPGTTEDHERNVEIASRNTDNYFALQQVAFHNAGESEAWKRVAHNVYSWLREYYPQVILEMPEGVFNPVISVDLDVKSFLADKKGATIDSGFTEIVGVLGNE